jgi:hypothetical protein
LGGDRAAPVEHETWVQETYQSYLSQRSRLYQDVLRWPKSQFLETACNLNHGLNSQEPNDVPFRSVSGGLPALSKAMVLNLLVNRCRGSPDFRSDDYSSDPKSWLLRRYLRFRLQCPSVDLGNAP